MANVSTMYVNSISPRDTAGVLFPNRPAFLATRGDGNVTTTLGVVPLNQTRYNIGGYYDVNGYYFTAPISGIYQLGFQAYFNDGAGGKRIGIRLNQNYSNFITMSAITAAGTDESIALSVAYYLNAGDKVDLASDSNVSRTLFYTGGGTYMHTFFYGYLVG